MQNSLQTETKVHDIHTGIGREDTKDLAQAISEVLADSFILYTKTLGVHWNIEGPAFYSLHKLTEEQYEDLTDAIDALAERIRALGHPAPAGFKTFNDLSEISCDDTLDNAQQMIEALVTDNQLIAKRLRAKVAVAEASEDVFTADMLTARIGQHEENAWMLRSLIS